MLENGRSYLRLQTCKRVMLYARATSVGEGVEKEKTTVNGKKSPTTPAIYRSVTVSATHSVGPKQSEITERLSGH
jgi:hypothetical protein